MRNLDLNKVKDRLISVVSTEEALAGIEPYIKDNYYHVSWLQIAIDNLRNDTLKPSMVSGNMTVEELIRQYAKDELDNAVEVE